MPLFLFSFQPIVFDGFHWWISSADSLPPEPAAFSVKTTPQTRNPKVTNPLSPAMSLTLQVNLRPHSPPHFALFISPHSVLAHIFSLHLSPLFPLPPPYMHPLLVTASHLFCLFLSHVLDFLSHNSLSLCNVRRMCWRQLAGGAGHGVMEDEVCAFINGKDPWSDFSTVWCSTTS